MTTSDGSGDSPGGMRLCWDDEDCPRDLCDGDLEQQDQFNVMCLQCERVWVHYKDETTHYLQGPHGENAAEKPRVATDGGVPKPDDGELEHEHYGHYNATPHADVDMPFTAWDEGAKRALEYVLGPPIAWHWEGGQLWLWGENLDESLLADIADACNDVERDYADGGHYEAAQNAERAASRIIRAEVHEAGEVMIT